MSGGERGGAAAADGYGGQRGGLAINGRFLSAQPTGVHRVGHELICQLGPHREALAGMFGGEVSILVPRNAQGPDAVAGIPVRRGSVLTGQLWEQLELPWRARGQVLLSLCNLSPLAHGRAVTMIHDAQTFSTPQSYSPAFRHFYQRIQPRIGRRALRVLTVSEFSRRELVRYGVAPEARIHVVHNGADHVLREEPDGSVVERLGLRRHGYVLALASTQAHKNIAVLLRAIAGEEDLRLVLFGGAGPAEFAAAGLAVPDNVTFAGRVSDAQLAGLMAEALCFAMPSTTEGFGLPPLEAMTLGCPAVVAPCGALPEVCGDAAAYAWADRPEEWRAAFRALADDAQGRAALAVRGRARAAGMSWAHAGANLLAELEEIAREVRAGAGGAA